jgi:hypothetical protein
MYNLHLGHMLSDVFHFDTQTICAIYLIWKWGSRGVMTGRQEWGSRGVMTGRQGMLFPPEHLIPEMFEHSLICISYRTYGIDYCSLFMPFRLHTKNRKVLYLISTMLPLNIGILMCYFLRIFKIQLHFNQILDPLVYKWEGGGGCQR